MWHDYMSHREGAVTVNVGAKDYFSPGGSTATLWLNVNDDTYDLQCAYSTNKAKVREKAEDMAKAIKSFNKKYKDVN